MTKRRTGDESELERLEEALRSSTLGPAVRGHDGEKPPADVTERLWARVRAKRDLHQRMEAARGTLRGGEGLAFPDLLKRLREIAGIQVAQLIEASGMQEEDYRQLEEKTLDPLSIPPASIARLLETFSLPLPLAEASLAISVANLGARPRSSRPIARSSGSGNVSAKRAAMADMEAVFALKRQGQATVDLQRFLKEVEGILKRWDA